MATQKIFNMETFNKDIKKHLGNGTAQTENQFNKKNNDPLENEESLQIIIAAVMTTAQMCGN